MQFEGSALTVEVRHVRSIEVTAMTRLWLLLQRDFNERRADERREYSF